MIDIIIDVHQWHWGKAFDEISKAQRKLLQWINVNLLILMTFVLSNTMRIVDDKVCHRWKPRRWILCRWIICPRMSCRQLCPNTWNVFKDRAVRSELTNCLGAAFASKQKLLQRARSLPVKKSWEGFRSSCC